MKIVRNKKNRDKAEETNQLSPWKVLVVDDEQDVHIVTRATFEDLQFEGNTLQILQAMSGIEAREILTSESDIAVAIIDIIMETDDAGLKLVDFIRNELKNSLIRLIIRTGQPGAAPEKEVVERYDINDYKDKTELTAQKLYTTMRIALMSYRDLSTLDSNRKVLTKIIDAAPELYRLESISQLFNKVLHHIIDLCNLCANNPVLTISHGLVVTTIENQVIVQAGTGRFADLDQNPEVKKIVTIGSACFLKTENCELLPPNYTFIPIRVQDKTMGFIYLENAHHLNETNRNLINIMINQCSSALENLQLYHSLKMANQETSQMLAIAEQAHKKADMANRAKSTFLANMSHELRTPLNGILGYTQILKRDRSLGEKQQNGINIIHRSGEYLLTLISDILDLSKIEANRIELYPADFHFGEFLQNIVDIFQMRVKQKDISFIYEKLSHLPEGVYADEKRLRQIIINLLSNAIKFTQKGGVGFKVGYHNGKIRFQIEDTGVGIASEELKNIFQPFWQVGDRNARAEGTGLGLSITKKLVEMMGGELHVHSTLGKGSTFWMALDLPKASDLVMLNKTEEPVIIGFEGESREILIVDDKEENRAVLINLLSPLGFEILEAVDGQECVDKTLKHKPDLILTDLVMPIMDGFEACRRIRRIEELKDIIIIMISASVFECHKQQSMEAGCDDFLPKPIRAKDLLIRLEKYLKLTWIYEETSGIYEKNDEAGSKLETDELVGPSKEQATVLFDLAMKGNLKGVVKQLDKFEQLDQKLTIFANQVRALADEFDEEQICDLIEQYIK